MGLFKRGPRQPEVLQQPEIRFVCEQDGMHERELKAALEPELAMSGNARRAYLARVEYDKPNAYEVALCIRGPEDTELVRRVGARFATLAGRNVHLDIVFLSESQEAELRNVCAPFYAAGQQAVGPDGRAQG